MGPRPAALGHPGLERGGALGPPPLAPVELGGEQNEASRQGGEGPGRRGGLLHQFGIGEPGQLGVGRWRWRRRGPGGERWRIGGRTAECGLHSAEMTTTTDPDVGKGIVGAVTSVVGRIGGRNAVICRALGSMRRGAITHADGVRLAEAADQAGTWGCRSCSSSHRAAPTCTTGVAALHGWGQAAAAISRCSGQVPVIVAATGPVVSGPALLLGLADLVVMSSDAVAFVSGPQMVEAFTGIQVGLGKLGGTADARNGERAVRRGVRRRRRGGGGAVGVPAVEHRRHPADRRR